MDVSNVTFARRAISTFVAFEQWMVEAAANEIIVEANAMVLSTADGSGEITTRTVLLKDISQGGFTFFTNYSSRKAQAIAMNSQVTLLFPWYAVVPPLPRITS